MTCVTKSEWLLLTLALLIGTVVPDGAANVIIESKSHQHIVGANITVVCTGNDTSILWRHQNQEIQNDESKWIVTTESKDEGIVVSRLQILRLVLHDSGVYECQGIGQSYGNVTLRVQDIPRLLDLQNSAIPVGQNAVISCSFSAEPEPTVSWTKAHVKLQEDNKISIAIRSELYLYHSGLTVLNVTAEDSGYYQCASFNKFGKGDKIGDVYILAQDSPNVTLTFFRTISTNAVLIKWFVDENNLPITSTDISVSIDGSDFILSPSKAHIKGTMAALQNVGSSGQSVAMKIKVRNALGSAEAESKIEQFLDKDPLFIPKATSKGSSLNSLNIAWTQPLGGTPEFELVSYFILSLALKSSGSAQEIKINASVAEHMVSGLQPSSEYIFKVAACMDIYGDRSLDCFPFSFPETVRTIDGTPSSINDVVVRCFPNSQSTSFMVYVEWKPPTGVNSHVDHYKLELIGTASYVNEEGRRQYYNNEKGQNVLGETRNFTFHNELPNTNYTVKIYAGSKRTEYSISTSAQCQMPVGVPSQVSVSWWKYVLGEQILLKLPVPRVSERNGTICCHQVVVVKMPRGADLIDIGKPGSLPLQSYDDVHQSYEMGAYVAEAFSGSSNLKEKYILLGDEKISDNWSIGCTPCLANTANEVPTRDSFGVRRRLYRSPVNAHIKDGMLFPDFNYTGFLILSVKTEQGKTLSSYSNYFPIVQLAVEYQSGLPFTELQLIYAMAGLFTFFLLLSVGICVLFCVYKKKNKQLEEATDSLRGSLGRLYHTLRRSHTLMSQSSIDVKPIPRNELVSQYMEKSKDSDLGFRKEFEMLPEKFADRTSRASDMTDNSTKNRYPDIKAFDQTRVKLKQNNNPVSSDYVNANYVLGYKERKKFICAQGPMEATVADFWRMIVEQVCGICVMLTNLEETGKVKCVKYWPEADKVRTYGNITVHLVKEKAYADYLVRTLRAEWGDGEEKQSHEVQQFHYLVWKDFVAPEHPVGVVAFLRRINEAYSNDMGSLLIHCSAGVGRTGTLVALDSLITELEEENQVSIYNHICDLRHQRNFLVQSLKQYVFVHRALMEVAQFGNTELSATKLGEVWKNHTHHDTISDSSSLEKEFERLNKVVDDRKSFTIATSEENHSKNRYDYILPYDSTRVILAPLPSCPFATYINASFMTGYDLAESFVVTQDPMENTIPDFWRMVFDQEIAVIVMLSELGSGENCCSKYWPDGPDQESSYEHIMVKSVTEESFPKYSMRTFLLTNTKSEDVLTVTQFHYIGWSGLVGEVPLVTQGLMEIISRVQSHTDATLSTAGHTLVHCSGGGDRSSVYVCLNNCLRQMHREGRVDLFQTARKIRAQRQFQLQEFAQYEFSYKALHEFLENKQNNWLNSA